MKNLHIVLVVLLMVVSLNIIAQDDDKPFAGNNEKTLDNKPEVVNKKGFDKSKLRIGPNINFGYNGRTLLVGLSPVVGYRAVKYFEPGIGFTYQLQDAANFPSNPGFTSHTIGGQIYVKIYPWKELFIYGEAQAFNFRARYKSLVRGAKNPYESVTYGNVLVGLGYNIRVGENSFMSLGLTVNLIPNALYNFRRQPLPLLGFNFGL
jgi:hypothetical protein